MTSHQELLTIRTICTQSPLVFWSAGGHQVEWGTGILLPQDFCGKTIKAVTVQPIKKLKFFRILQSLSWRPPADQKARRLWVRDCHKKTMSP